MAISPHLDTDISYLMAHYKNDLDTIRHLHETNESSREILRDITDATDTLVIRLLLHLLHKNLNQDEMPSHLLLLAQGGYGRRELHPQSDIDLLFLHSSNITQKESDLIKEYYRTLYDMGFKVGNTCREYQEAINCASTDLHSQTAMIESRFLAGDWRLFENFKHDLWRSLRRGRMDHIRQKMNEREERFARYGKTINITEPNIKESIGGLRDYHFGLWLGALYQSRTMNLLHLKRCHLIDDQMMVKIEQAVEFLWRLRNDLHFLTNKEQDVLDLQLQHDISSRLGFRDRRGRLAEEEMMREYYQHALTLYHFAQHMIKKCSPRPIWSILRKRSRKPLTDGFFLRADQIQVPLDFHFFEHNPQRLLKAFIHAAEQRASLSDETITAIKDNIELVDQAFLHDKKNAALLRQFFSIPHSIEFAVQEMRQTGLLERIFPEWRSITNLVRYDLVHRYTVDEHSFLTLYHLEHMNYDTIHFSQERYKLWHNCQEKDVLRLASLLHDIGKGRMGDHSLIGARLTDDIARRMRLSQKKRKRLIFLVKNHMMMSRVAQHRDLADPQVTADFSDAFDSLEELDMLYLLTYADMRSVSPEAMTQWKNNLLRQLYINARNFMVSDAEIPFEENEHLKTRREELIEKMDEDFDHELVHEHLDHLPNSYCIMQNPEDIRLHLELIKEYDNQNPVIRLLPHHNLNCLEIVLVTQDKVGLFNRICTAIMLENFSIEEARLNTRSDGIVANNIFVRDALKGNEINQTRQLLLRERLQRLLTMEGSLPNIPKTLSPVQLGRTSFEPKVKLLNDISAKYTILEIRCADRRGLLQNLSSVLCEMEINIYFARIITEGSRMTDVFYIADINGEKIQDEEFLDKIQKEIEKILKYDEHHG